MVYSDNESPFPTYQYQRIARELWRRLDSGQYPDDRLPSERQLMVEFGVQRATVRRALETLVAEGVLLRDSTRGTRVAPRTLPATSLTKGSVLLVVRTFNDTTAPSTVFRGLTQRLGDAGLRTFWHDPGDKDSTIFHSDPENPIPSLAVLREREVRGVVFWPHFPVSVASLRTVRDSLSLIVIDRLVPGFEADFVGFQDRAGGKTVTEHLLALGHRRIGFLSGEPRASAVRRRLDGYVDALRAAGQDPDLHHLAYHQEGGSRRLTVEMVQTFLQGGGDPLTAVVCANDLVAAHLIQFARGLGRRVPEDLAVTGFGNLFPSMMDAFGITTVAQPFDELGQVAADLALRRLRAAPGSNTTPEEIELPLRLIVRESCGSPATDPT